MNMGNLPCGVVWLLWTFVSVCSMDAQFSMCCPDCPWTLRAGSNEAAAGVAEGLLCQRPHGILSRDVHVVPRETEKCLPNATPETSCCSPEACCCRRTEFRGTNLPFRVDTNVQLVGSRGWATQLNRSHWLGRPRSAAPRSTSLVNSLRPQTQQFCASTTLAEVKMMCDNSGRSDGLCGVYGGRRGGGVRGHGGPHDVSCVWRITSTMTHRKVSVG